ncbi:MAG: histidine kinase dimerization/phosphoacceptor domain -containing protein [Alphaproteobacteria bacterium]
MAATANDLVAELLEGFRVAAFLLDDQGIIHYANRQARKILPRDPLQKRLADLCIHEGDSLSATISLWGGSGSARPDILMFPGPEGAVRKHRWIGSRTAMTLPGSGRLILVQSHETSGEPLAILKSSLRSLQKEVRERRHAQSLTQEALAERELMLRELQHRVKNNIQIITSLVRSSMRGTTSPDALEVLDKIYGRLVATTSVQQLLYQEAGFLNIDAREMLETLVSSLAGFVGPEHVVTRRADATPLPNNTALPLGLIVNELFTNAIKYGRNASGIAEVDISLTRTEMGFCLEVKDKGPGIAPDTDTNGKEKKASGLGLVRGLVRQLGGSLDIRSDFGTHATIKFETQD